MSCDLYATGAFKRMSGLWLPSDARTPSNANLYYEHDRFFRKQESPHVIEQVGGGRAGQAPTESARILFWGDDNRCRMCDLNFASVKVHPGCANAGKVVLSVSRYEDFRDGYFVAIEAIPEQFTVDALTSFGSSLPYIYTQLIWSNTQNNIFGKVRPGYSTNRYYRRLKGDNSQISEPTNYVNYAWPSANVVDYPVNYSFYGVTNSDYAIDASQTMPNIGVGFWEPTFNLLIKDGGGSQFTNDGTQVLTFMKYKVTCGTVANGSPNTMHTRELWTGIAGEDSNIDPQLWLGIGEEYIKTGFGRRTFMPEMSVSHDVQDQWTQGETYWKVDAIKGTLVDVTWRDYSTGETYKQRSAGLGAISASGMQVLATDVMESPKYRYQRASLVTSAQGLIWRGGVIPGINEEHTQKAMRCPETSWPFKQNDAQPVSISVGAPKARPSQLVVSFSTTTTKTQSFDSPEINNVVTTELLEKPVAIITNYQTEDESGSIGRVFPGYYSNSNTFGSNIPRDFTNKPESDPWQGVFDFELNRLQGIAGTDTAFDDFGTYWYGTSDQSRSWKTFKADGLSFFIENIGPGKTFFDGTYTATNVMPDGTKSSPDLFYAEPDRSGDVLEAVPTLKLPGFASRDIAPYKVNLYNVKNSSDPYGSNSTLWQTVNSYARLSFMSPVIERHTPSAATKTKYGFTWWEDVSTSYTITSKTVSVDVVAAKTQTLQQAVTTETAASQGYWTFPTGPATGFPEPVSEFYKADYSRLDDYNRRLADAAEISVIKSCKWNPKKTQMFCTLRRYVRNQNPYESSAPLDFYGGTVSGADKLDMLDTSFYEGSEPRQRSDPVGGVLTIILRRTWQIELTIAKAKPTYTPCTVLADNLQKYIGWYGTTGVYSDIWVETQFWGTRQVKFGFKFDIDQAETIVHRMNHEHTEVMNLALSEEQFLNLEAGGEIEMPINQNRGRGWSSQQGINSIYASQSTTVRFKLV